MAASEPEFFRLDYGEGKRYRRNGEAYAALMSSWSQVASDLHGFRKGAMTVKAWRLIAIVLAVLVGGIGRASGQTLTTLHSFSSSDGANPNTALVQGSDGNFYGTTYYGGANNKGTVFRISPSGSLTNLHSFSGSDGSTPTAVLVQGADGNFYGTTFAGGGSGSGTVFEISSSGSLTTLWSFTGQGDGGKPYAGLVQGSDGNFYGTTMYGGTSTNCKNGCGTVFRTATYYGSLTTIYSFSSGDGAHPVAGLIQGSDGSFYGTTEGGGTNGFGTVFRISTSGTLTTLYSFSLNEGYEPHAGLVQGSDGYFYGTTPFGGTNDNGTVFQISTSGTLTTLCKFLGYPNGGVYPYGGLVQGSDGNFYGMTSGGGTNDDGTVFMISSSGSLRYVHLFDGTDGEAPEAGLVQGSDGNFYGTTFYGGTGGSCGGNGCGTVFKLTVSLNPPPYPVNQITNVHISAQNIIFSIPSIAGEKYQLQFSSSMNPTNWVNEGGTITSIGALLTLTNSSGVSQPQGFYRFAITP
jgi:uncharacterized repeat protein (TIGR03803 family)